MDFIDSKAVLQQRLASSLGLDSYSFIMNSFLKTNVATDTKFQKTFNGFYRVRRDADWRKCYYELFENIKNDPHISFDTIFDELLKVTGKAEASFTSKMLATIKPTMPIWDTNVLKNLGLKVPAQHVADRPQRIKSVYAEMQKWYSDYLNTENARACISEFDRTLPGYAWISDIKKIDYFIYSMR